jgi:hypothetical protein
MNSLIGRAVPILSATLATLALLTAPVAAQPRGRSVPPGIARNGNCPPGLARQGRCGYNDTRSNSDWCLDRNHDGVCDYANNDRRSDEEIYGRRDRRDGDIYDRRDRNDGSVYGRDGRVYDRNGNVIYDQNGRRVDTRDRGKQENRNRIGDLINRARRGG